MIFQQCRFQDGRSQERAAKVAERGARRWRFMRGTTLVIAALLTASPVTRAASDLYAHLTLIDPQKETRTANAYLLVTDGKIAAMGTGEPKKAATLPRLHDMSGRYAMAG